MREVIRVSYGSAVELGLAEGILWAWPRTAYLLLSDGACRGRCAFCPQSLGQQPDRVSRVSWPEYPLDLVLEAIRSSRRVERACIQCADQRAVFEELPRLVQRLTAGGRLPVSVSMPPRGARIIYRLRDAGADMVTIPIDCASPRLFNRVKGGRLEDCMVALGDAVAAFGERKVGTHVIVGLGETEEEVVSVLARVWEMGVRPSLFAFTPVRGTAMAGRQPPDMQSYRRLQLARHLIVELGAGGDGFTFDAKGRLEYYPLEEHALGSIVKGGRPFETGGCPGCNRPYFNERVTGSLFNFPYPPSRDEIIRIEEELYGKTPAD